jgi:hypothetical protein
MAAAGGGRRLALSALFAPSMRRTTLMLWLVRRVKLFCYYAVVAFILFYYISRYGPR